MDKQTREGMGSSKKQDWLTPKDLFETYDKVYNFTTDICTNESNHLNTPLFFTEKNDGLTNYDKWQGNIWCNPPYSGTDQWVEACTRYASEGKGTAVMLIAARTDTDRFHRYIWDTKNQRPKDGVVVHFLKGRIKFLDASTGLPTDPAFFPSMVVIFKGAVIVTPPSPVAQEEKRDGQGLFRWIKEEE
jgi:phage N-6-adenine-methyltransferase